MQQTSAPCEKDESLSHVLPLSGVLYLVSTPIGNLADMSARAIETLRLSDHIAAEDTRRGRKLLSHFGIKEKHLFPLHVHSTPIEYERAMAFLLRGDSLSYISDAGTPCVSDPGEILAKMAVARGLRIVPVLGPSSVLGALVGSGLASGFGFRFLGFLSRDKKKRVQHLALVCETSEPLVLFESPHRTRDTLKELAELMPSRSACVARELTKVYEEFVRGTLSELAEIETDWRGEIAIVLGAYEAQDRSVLVSDLEIDKRIDEELKQNLHAKRISEKLSAWSGRPKREIYERVFIRKALLE